ncbi:MAG: ABC transporter substrate binding protein [Bryobacteraceae bacterium]|nr:ABC transporter substrate binding protein [Bryobacteraceae bacterium]
MHPTDLYSRNIAQIDAGIRATFAQVSRRVELFPESLHLPQNAQNLSDVAEDLKRRHPAELVDLVIANSSYVDDFLNRYPNLWPGIPRVHLGTDISDTDRVFGPNATGLKVRIEMEATIDLAVRLQPNARNVVLVGGAYASDQHFLRVVKRHLAEKYPAIQVRSLDNLPYQRQLEELGKLPPDFIAMYLTLYQDSTGAYFDIAQLAREIAQASTAPIYYSQISGVGEGYVGCVCMEWERVGREAAVLALKVLQGQNPESIPVPPTVRGPTAVDWRQLNRWGISESNLPPGTRVLFRPRNIWSEYRWYVIGAMGVVLVQALLIAGLLFQRAKRRRAEADVRESESRFRTIADSAPVMIVICNAQSNCEWCNKAWLEFTGATLADSIGLSYDSHFHPDDRRSIRDASPGRPLEMRLRGRDGEYRWVLCTQTIRAGGDKGFIGSGIDISERKETEAALQKNRAEVAHLARLSLMGELLASISHELNQPLTSIRTNAEVAQILIGRENPDLEKIRECLADIVGDDYRASEIIVRLRGLAKRQTQKPVSLDIESLVVEVMRLVQSDALLHKVILSVQREDNLPLVHGDRIGLQQVLLNLLLNAVSAAQECPPPRRKVAVSVARAGASVQIDVRDWANGIRADKLSRLFEPFFTTKPDGLGMGLPICKNIIESHNGRLWAENNPDEGATFHFTLPISS